MLDILDLNAPECFFSTASGKPYRSALTSAHDADREIIEHFKQQDDEPTELDFN